MNYLEVPEQILYQFTLKCNKNCSYCGSKKLINKQNENLIDRSKIIDEIISIKPKQITITGGQPSVLFDESLICVQKLSNAGIKVKILTNGNIFPQIENRCQIGEQFDEFVRCYGFSVNTAQDIYPYFDHLIFKHKTTVVTNFGTHNIHLFDNIAKYAVQFNCWQVQLTMGNEFQLDLDQIKKLQEDVQRVSNSKLINIIRADNFNCNKCKAGITGFSVCYNGDVVPCLSYRSWKNNMSVQGNLFETSLKQIWQKRFQFYRNREHIPCCKDITGIFKLHQKQVLKPSFEEKQDKNYLTRPIFVYGIYGPIKDNDIDWNTTMVYGVGESFKS